jgi:protein N-lysine methyltransferase METTL21A
MEMLSEGVIEAESCKSAIATIGNTKLSLLTLPRCGTGGRVWCSSYVLASYLQHYADIVAGARVLELGAGAGVAGLISAMLGAVSVHLTDRGGKVMEQLQHNVEAFRAEQRTPSVSSCTVEICDWDVAAVEGMEGAPFGLVLGAEIKFCDSSFDALLQTLLRVTDANLVVLIVERLRLHGLFEQEFIRDVAPSMFKKMMRGFWRGP